MNVIHPTAYIDPTARIGDGVEVGAYAVIKGSAVIGNCTTIKEFALIGRETVIGDACSIGAYTEVRAGCLIGDKVRLGSKCLLADGTEIGSRSHCSGTFTTCNKPDPGKRAPSVMGAGFYAGVDVVIMPGVRIGLDVKIGASSTVFKDVPDGETWFGVPAKRMR